MTAEITCILNVFKRFSIFEEQLAAIRSQTILPKRIIVWNNAPEHHEALKKYASDDLIVVTTSRNMGVWARFFTIYPLLSGQFVCVFDDDTIPGARWFQNCVETMKTYNALLGTIGVIFTPGDTYYRERRVGWDEPNESAEYVDIVGHSWFFKREWISTFTKELPNIDEKYLTCGEDMHLSYTLRKYLHIPTIVPPHPTNDKTIWGADKAKSWEYGNWNSTFCETGIDKFHKAMTDYQARGLEKIRVRESAIRKWSTCLDYFLDKLRRREPFSIMRFADGEKYVLDNTTLTNCDHWTFRSGSILNNQLLSALKMTNTNVYYGVSGPSDCPKTYKYYYNTILNKSNITYANVFVNQNYPKWVEFLKSFEAECVLISCSRPASGKIGGVRVLEHVPISDKLVNDWDARCDEYLAIMKTLAVRYNRTLFFVSAGPLSEVFIQTMYELNPDNTYLDVGSSIDEFTKGKITRPYQTTNDSHVVLDLNTVEGTISQLTATFTRIYDTNSWNMGQKESKSGAGSTLTSTENIRKMLQEYIRDWSIQTMVDTSCGDWNWMKHIKDSLPDYTGIDIVSAIVEQNNKQFSSSNVKFVNTDFLSYIKSLPDKSVDLILCRHTLEHLPTQYNIDFMNECKRVCAYLLVTNYEKEGTPNVEVPASVYRPINLRRYPYSDILIPYYHTKFYDGPSERYHEETYMHVYRFFTPPVAESSKTIAPVFSGGWSYTQKEMNEFFRHVVFFPSMSILEFGSGDSTIKLYDYFKSRVDNLTFYTYESDPKFMKKHDSIHYVSYDIEKMDDVVIPDIQFDIVLIDGPNGDKRSKWYAKIRKNVKAGTIILVDDFNHYKCFSEELDKNFKYELLSHSDEPFVPYGEHSWKIVRVIECI